MQIDIDEKYQSKFNVMQAELDNQLALLQSEREGEIGLGEHHEY